MSISICDLLFRNFQSSIVFPYSAGIIFRAGNYSIALVIELAAEYLILMAL